MESAEMFYSSLFTENEGSALEPEDDLGLGGYFSGCLPDPAELEAPTTTKSALELSAEKTTDFIPLSEQNKGSAASQAAWAQYRGLNTVPSPPTAASAPTGTNPVATAPWGQPAFPPGHQHHSPLGQASHLASSPQLAVPQPPPPPGAPGGAGPPRPGVLRPVLTNHLHTMEEHQTRRMTAISAANMIHSEDLLKKILEESQEINALAANFGAGKGKHATAFADAGEGDKPPKKEVKKGEGKKGEIKEEIKEETKTEGPK